MVPLCFIFGLSKTSKKNKLIKKNMNDQHRCLLHILFYYTLRFFSLFVFVNAAGHYFRVWTGSIWTGQVPALF